MPSSNPRILFIAHDSGRTGATIGLLTFMRWLCANSDCKVGTIVRAPGPLETSFYELGPCVTLGRSFLSRSRLGRRLRRHLPQSLREETGRIRRMFSDNRYSLIYSNTVTNGDVLHAVGSFGVPVVTHAHELEYWIARAGAKNLNRVLAHTTAFIAASAAVRDNLQGNHGVAAEKITVVHEHIQQLSAVPPSSDRVSARRALGLSPEAFVVGGCGVEHWRKGRDLIPQLLASLHRQRPERDFHFLWVGRPGNAEEEFKLQHDLRHAGVEAFFHSTGEVENPFQYYPAMDVFALLSRDDPYPLACLEVAALEKPVVCFANAGGMPEFVRDGCGFVSPYLDLESMARDIVRLADDPELALASGKRARAKVAQENTIETTAPRLRSVMEKLLGVQV